MSAPEQTAVTGRAVASLSAGSQIAAIVPTSIDETFRLAQLIHQSGLSPYQLKSAQAVTVVLLKGLEIGLPPMASLECIGVINGKACLFGDGIPAILWGNGFKIKEWYEGEGDKLTAKCLITRPDGTEIPGEFAVQDAKDAKLWDTRERVTRKGKDGGTYECANDAPWFRYRKRMLRMRCRIWTGRDAASDVLKGIPIFEEQRDIELARDEYREVAAAPALPEIPDIPDEPAPAQEPTTDDAPEPLSDEDGFIQSLTDEMGAVANDPVLAQETWDGNEHMLERLSPDGQKRMLKLKPVSEAAE